MALTTLAGVKAGLIPPAFFTKLGLTSTLLVASSWKLAGNPVAGANDATLNGVTLSAPQTGAIPWSNPLSGNSYLARFQAQVGRPGLATSPCSLILCDRLWHNGGFTITSTSPQSITSPTWPARDELGGTAGQGVLLGLEVSATVGSGTPTITVAYTDSDNNAQTSTAVSTGVTTSVAGTLYLISLAAGSRGVKSVQSLTLSASWISGTINLVAFRPIASLENPIPFTSSALDAVTAGLPRIYDSSVLFFIANMATQGVLSTVSGKLDFAQG